MAYGKINDRSMRTSGKRSARWGQREFVKQAAKRSRRRADKRSARDALA